MKETLIQHIRNKQTCGQRNINSKGIQEGQNRGILHEINKAKETENSKLGYLDMSMRAHTEPAYAYVYFEPAYACKKHAHVDTPQTLTQKQKLRKRLESLNLTT